MLDDCFNRVGIANFSNSLDDFYTRVSVTIFLAQQ